MGLFGKTYRLDMKYQHGIQNVIVARESNLQNGELSQRSYNKTVNKIKEMVSDLPDKESFVSVDFGNGVKHEMRIKKVPDTLCTQITDSLVIMGCYAIIGYLFKSGLFQDR